MDNSLYLLIIVLVILVSFSAYFSATETAFSTVSKIKLKHLANKGNKKAVAVLNILDNYNNFLSAVLIGNNIVNIVSTTIATVVFTSFFFQQGATIASVVMTIVILLFGEITPKSIAREYAEEFVMATVGFLNVILVILTPLRFIFSLWEKFIRLFFKTNEQQGMTGEELITMIEEVEKDGAINSNEGELIISAIEFNDAEVQDIFTPRVDVIAIDIDWDIDKVEEVFLNNNFSRLPVYQDSIDNIIGFIHERDLHKLAKHRNGDILSILQPPLRVTESMKIYELLKVIQLNKSHLAIVIDEYGGTAGIITLEDIIEELVGDIYDEHDEVVEEIHQLNEHCYIVDGSTDVEEVFDLFHLDVDENEYDANTISGWVSEHLSKLPVVGETIDYKHLVIEILEADDKKINKLKITSHPENVEGIE